jgi:hypothetical protein
MRLSSGNESMTPCLPVDWFPILPVGPRYPFKTERYDTRSTVGADPWRLCLGEAMHQSRALIDVERIIEHDSI